MNRASRRKQIKRIANNVIKGRAVALAKKQYGFGLVVTTHLIAVIFWRWTWTPWDRRGKQ
jgi:hypothetical protein